MAKVVKNAKRPKMVKINFCVKRLLCVVKNEEGTRNIECSSCPSKAKAKGGFALGGCGCRPPGRPGLRNAERNLESRTPASEIMQEARRGI